MRNETAPRCESCGYEILGQDVASNCPECGTPVQDSMNRRIGSPWQRRRSVRAWLETCIGAAFRPTSIARILTCDFSTKSLILPLLNYVLASVVLGIGFHPAADMVPSGRPALEVLINQIVIVTIWAGMLLLFAVPLLFVPAAVIGRLIWRSRRAPVGATLLEHAMAALVPLLFVLVAALWCSVLVGARSDFLLQLVAAGGLGTAVWFVACTLLLCRGLRFANLTLPDGTLVRPKPMP